MPPPHKKQEQYQSQIERHVVGPEDSDQSIARYRQIDLFFFSLSKCFLKSIVVFYSRFYLIGLMAISVKMHITYWRVLLHILPDVNLKSLSPSENEPLENIKKSYSFS